MTDNLIINLNTGLGEVEFNTDKLTGVFHALVFKCTTETKTAPVELAIESEQGYTIFHSRDLTGIKYIPIRSEVYDKNYHTFKEFGNTPFYLNEKLRIKLIGPVEQEVELVLKII